MSSDKPPTEQSAVELIEEAVALLRRTPAAVILCYFAGAVPFWLMMLFFIGDMSRSAYAVERVGLSSLGLALLFLWMKCWQTIYTAGLEKQLSDQVPHPWRPMRVARLVLTQAKLQFWGLLIRPLAYLIMIPTGWVCAFYQTATILGDGRPDRSDTVFNDSIEQAKLWPVQTHSIILILSFFTVFVWIDIVILLGALPLLWKGIFGIETMASRSPMSYIASSTFHSVAFALTFLCVDPLFRAIFVVRCFHGLSLRSGADIRASLGPLRKRAGAISMVSILACSSVSFTAPPAAAETAVETISSGDLDRSISEVLEHREYAWRMPRHDEAVRSGVLGAWLKDAGKALERFLDKVFRALGKAFKWLFGRWLKPAPVSSGSTNFTIPPLTGVIYGGAALVALLGAWMLWRKWRRPRRKVLEAEPIVAVPNLQAEDLVADQLPEDRWLGLVRELMGKGELRLAMRAAYLAGIAHLGEVRLVSIARSKSNRDYQRELLRRARTREELLAAFNENVAAFERVWYGPHPVTPEVITRFTENLEKIRAC